jgi:ATP-dependent Clp protease adaptor protein ClpS
MTTTTPDVEESVKDAFAKGWCVVVWNDPINLMSFVVYVFQKVLNMKKADAERHMLEVHQKGRSTVARETREKAEMYLHQFHAFGLKATLEEP